ncbi:hypothetical protein PUW24_22365 [Paenibacillus urinalis]|uniref:Uncharacterized protein n=1 Tax=Paenibacillus urinalis TaxID=521520 RepID=A0AAX3MU87_9BACL|nr:MULTISPECIES: hypothetical protein [Paenibacillus]WDH80807.1 hypothetical protein PUW23_14770 [Paenibacillus urinalis]WDH96861.1 hypothetical protein PUW24_22365 [Paenibacillus urinalis]WDI00502.1 hypothetical protein PUW25_14510 [Paenibacillus urinalis]GAK39176.1 hypothetical protein TCA2_1664 [Paenibacillus sp. TCA20]
MSPSIQSTAAPLRRMAWGFLFVLIDLNLGPIDILPDFVGFILIYFGLSRLGERFKDFSRAKGFSLILLFMSIAGIFVPPVDYNSFASIPLYVHIFAELLSLLTLFLLVFIFRGLTVIGESGVFHNVKIQEVISLRKNGLLGLHVLLMIMYPLAFNMNDTILSTIFIFTIIQLLFYLLFIALLFRMAKVIEKWKGSVSV